MANFSEENCTLLGDFNDDSVASEYCNVSQVRTLCLNACQILSCEEDENPNQGTSSIDLFYQICVRLLTFLLLAGFAATVDTRLFVESFKSKGVYVGLVSQFAVMPFLGFLTVLCFSTKLDTFLSVMLILTCACPGGAYSNWFCSMCNADLSLSVAMTTAATLLAVVFLPLNVLIYLLLFQVITQPGDSRSSQDSEAQSLVSGLPYKALFLTLATVVAGVLFGLVIGYKMGHRWQRVANIVGNVAGILLQLLGLFASGTSCAPPWEQSIYVFLATLCPLVLGILSVFFITSIKRFKLPKPQRISIIIEAGYQNIGIATGVALSLGSEGRAAAVIPILYGIFQGVIFVVFCVAVVYFGWTLTPPKTRILRILFDDFQELIAVHPHYEEWRKDHPNALKGFSEEELEKLRNILNNVSVNEIQNRNEAHMVPQGEQEEVEPSNNVVHYDLDKLVSNSNVGSSRGSFHSFPPPQKMVF